MTPTLVPFELLPSAIALRSTVSQAVVVVGPAIGGLLFALGPEVVYATGAVLMLIAVGFVVPMRPRAIEAAPFESGRGSRLGSLLAGLRFVRRTPVLLGAISLDLFAVLFGGAVALLPVFARDILDVGPVGLGVLRSAPAVGAMLAGIMLTRRPLRGMAGRKLLIVVAVFGASMVVFGLSQIVPALVRGAGRQRLRGHDQHEHPLDDHGARDAGRAARPGQRGRDGLHQRLERARRLRVGRRGRAGRRRAGGRGRAARLTIALRARSGRGSSRRWPGSTGSSRCTRLAPVIGFFDRRTSV